MNVGLYPKLINDSYYFFTEREVLTGYTSNDWQQAYDKKMYVGNLNESQIVFNTGNIVGNPNRGLYLNNFFQYMDLRTNEERIGTPIENKDFFLLPSCGFLPFNQSKFECSNNNDKMVTEMTGNTSVYNGTVRTLWLSPNYGFFNNDLVTKPTPTQYLKQIFTGDSMIQDAFSIESDVQYSTIEELFSIFDKETLDKFETEFLNFCKPLNDSVPIMDGETNTSTFFNVANATDRRFRNIQSVLSEIFGFAGDFTKTSSSDKDSFNLASLQMDNTVNFMKDFLNYDVVLKLGNVGEFNQRIFGSFVTPSTVTQPIDYGNYVQGTLPGDGSGITLVNSQLNNSDEWNTLRTYVGFSTIDGLEYSDNGSYITDFFIDNNIDFTTSNIQQLSKIIKIYATQKLKDNSITAQNFNSTVQQLLDDQITFRQTVLNNTFNQLRNKLPNYTESNTTGGISAVDGNQPKLEVYSTLKTFNDKWIAGGNFKTRTLFEDFLFLDRANRDIGDTFTIDVISLKGYLKGKVSSYSLMSLIGYILSQNNFIFMALPSYINFYGIQEASKNGTPTVNPDIANSAFGTFLSVDYQDSRPKFLCMYVGKPSEHLDMKENKSSRFKTDVFDLRRGSNNPLLENQSNKIDWSRSNKVVGFNLDFGIRNQNIFKSISLDQNQYKNTSESFQVLSDMANQAAGDKVAQQTTSLYNIYRTRSYTCSVSSMGNMMIQPTMYFNLRHVPMFYGPYFITNVSHNINVNGFETSFEGMRQPIFSFPSIDKLVMSVNKNLLKKYETFYRKKQSQSVAQNTTNQNNETRINNPLVPDESSACNDITQFPSIGFVDFENTRIAVNDVINHLNTITNYSRSLRAYSLGVCYLMNSGIGSFDCTNNNLFGVNSTSSRYQNLTGFTNGQVCVKNNSQSSQVNGQVVVPTIPIFSFENKENSIKFFIEFFVNYNTIIDKLISLSTTITNNDEKLANALTYLYLSTWVQDYATGKTGAQIKQETDTKISNGTFTQQQFDDIKEKMLNAVIKILA